MILQILTAISTLSVFILSLFAPFYVEFVQDMGESISFAGFSWALFMITTGICMLLISKWESTIKHHEKLYAAGALLRAVVFLSYAFMGSIYQLLGTQLIFGFSYALSGPAFYSLFTKNVDHNNSIIHWARWEACTVIGTGIAALIGGFFIESFGYEILFILMAALSVGISVVMWNLQKKK